MRWFLLTAVVFTIDQITKYLVIQSIQLHESVNLFATVNLTRVHNPGAMFSFLGNAGGWQRWFLIVMVSLISIVLVLWLRSIPVHRKWLAVTLALLLGGAVGNLIDRVLYGYVIDFIDISLSFLPFDLFNPWPTFNIADCAVSVGVVMLIIDTFWFDRALVSTHMGRGASETRNQDKQ